MLLLLFMCSLCKLASEADDGFRDNPAKEGHPPIREGLEDWQRVQLERQEEELKRLKKQRCNSLSTTGQIMRIIYSVNL